MDGSKWADLFGHFARRADAARHRKEHAQQLMAWYDEQTKLVMMLMREVAQERARAFQASTDQRVDVCFPSSPPLNVAPDGPFMSFMSLSLGMREVHLYSHRQGVAPPAIHFFVIADKRSVSDRKCFVSHTGCRIEARSGGGFLLLSARPGPRTELSVDDVTYRAFELLLADPA